MDMFGRLNLKKRYQKWILRLKSLDELIETYEHLTTYLFNPYMNIKYKDISAEKL